MKHLVLFIVAFTATITVRAADAETANALCGQIKKQIIAPVCKPGEMCAQYFRIAHFLVMPSEQIELQTQDEAVLTQIMQSEGTPVCVQGEQPAQAKFFEVTAIAPDPSVN